LPLFLSVLALGLAGPGCSENGEREPADAGIALQDVPASVMDVARAELPGVEFEEAWTVKNAQGMIEGYEIRGKNDRGKVREARISPQGKILETE
jgi:hypothetical protein